MHAINSYIFAMSVSILALGVATAHEFQPNAKKAPPNTNLIDASEFDRLVMNAPDDGRRWVLSRTLLWKPGSTLIACFLNGSNGSRSSVMNDAEYLVSNSSRPVNLKIAFANGAATNCRGTGPYNEDIRVSFDDGCCSAYIGWLSHNATVAQGANVFLQQGLDDHTIKHELLHALGSAA